MAEGAGKDDDPKEGSESGPGHANTPFVLMEDLLDKLKVLNYDKELLKSSTTYKPLSKHYFAMGTNSGEQFYMFVSLAAWLIRKAGNSRFEQPQEHDDPNALVANILEELRKTNANVDFAPSKLKTGSGEQCIYVLNHLADGAVKKVDFDWNNPIPPKEEAEEPEVVENEEEMTAEQFEDVEPEAADDEDEDGSFLNLGESIKNKPSPDAPKKDILQSQTDATEWKAEVERVIPSLKITIRPDAKDWRGHFEQMQTLNGTMKETMAQAGPQLEKLAADIGRAIDKIANRERYLNQQLEGLLGQFRSGQDRLAEATEKYKEASGGVTERSKKLAQISEELDQVKQEMEERGSNLTDGAPLVKIKQAMTRLQQEVQSMDIQIAVMEQAVLQSQMRDRSNLQHDMYEEPINQY